jgi:hypothetical protein
LPIGVFHILTEYCGETENLLKVECASNEFVATTHFLHQKRERGGFLRHILMVDKSWILSFDPKLMQEI